MQAQKTILVLVEQFGQGGAERVAAMLAKMLHDSGQFRVYLYAVNHTDTTTSLPSGLSTGWLNRRPAHGILNKIAAYPKRWSALRKLKKQLAVDLTVSSLWPVDWINALTGRDKKVAIIQINILNNEQNAMMVRFRRLVTAVYRRFDAIVLGGANLKSELTGFFRIDSEKLTVIQNPINTRLIDTNINEPVGDKLNTILTRYKICTAANRLHPIKNTEALIGIYKLLENRKDVRFLVIGEGEEKDRIKKTIEQAGLKWSQIEDGRFDEQAHFYFLNFQNNIHNIISRSKIFLFPTKGEGLPLGLLEAMYSGVPVVVSDCPNGGISEAMEAKQPFDIARPRTVPERTEGGYLMPVPLEHESILQWKEKIEEILNMEAGTVESLKNGGRSIAMKFDQEKIKLQWIGLFNNILNEK